MSDEAPAKNVVEALIRVMRDLPSIGKDSHAAPQQGGYAYRGIDQITPEAQPLFVRHGVLFGIPRVVHWEVRDITVNNKPWTDVYEEIEYDVYGPGGVDDKLTVGPILAIGRDNADKGSNKCLTQAYKYALLQALCISDAKDDGDQASVEADHAARKTEPPPGQSVAAAKRALLAELEGKADDPKAAALEIWSMAEPATTDHEGTAWVPPAEQEVLERVADEWLAQHADDDGGEAA